MRSEIRDQFKHCRIILLNFDLRADVLAEHGFSKPSCTSVTPFRLLSPLSSSTFFPDRKRSHCKSNTLNSRESRLSASQPPPCPKTEGVIGRRGGDHKAYSRIRRMRRVGVDSRIESQLRLPTNTLTEHDYGDHNRLSFPSSCAPISPAWTTRTPFSAMERFELARVSSVSISAQSRVRTKGWQANYNSKARIKSISEEREGSGPVRSQNKGQRRQRRF